MHATRHNPTTTTTTTTTREMTDSEEKKEPTTTEREEEPTTKDAPESPKVGEKRHRDPGEDEESKDETREVRGKIDGNDETTEKEEPGEEKKETTEKTTETAAAATTTTTTTTTGGFGSALSGAGFGGFGGLKSAAASGGGFGGFAAAKASSGGGFASAPKVPVFSASSAPVALFGASKKKGSDDEEEGDDDPEREVANDSIKPVVELELVETKTGEEDETCAFRTEGALFEYVTDAEKGTRWVDRGRGDLHLNEGENGSRIVMRAKGNYRLMLNAALFKGQKFQLMEGGKGVSFSCKNVAAGADAKMSTFALKMRAAASNAQSQAEGFHNAATKAIAKLSEEA